MKKLWYIALICPYFSAIWPPSVLVNKCLGCVLRHSSSGIFIHRNCIIWVVSFALDVLSGVFWEDRIEHLSNCTVGTCMVFLQCECGGGFSGVLLGWMKSHTLCSDVASLRCGWGDVGKDLFLLLKSSPTICIDLAFLRNAFWCDL